jgi:hypothetical protein
MPKKKNSKEKPLLELSMNRDIMYEAIRALTTFSSYDLNPIRVELYRHGLVIICGDAGMVFLMAVALGKKALKSYSTQESTYFSVSDEDLKDLKSLISSASTKGEKGKLPLEITFDPPCNLATSIGTLKKRILTGNEDSDQSISMLNQMKKLFPQMEPIAKLDSEMFLTTIKDMGYQTIHDGSELAKFLKENGKDLEFSMDLDLNDDVTATFKPHRKHPVNVKVTIHSFKKGIKAITPLALRASKHLFIHSKDNFPMIFTCHNTSPEESSTFKKDIELWYCIAPTLTEG